LPIMAGWGSHPLDDVQDSTRYPLAIPDGDSGPWIDDDHDDSFAEDLVLQKVSRDDVFASKSQDSDLSFDTDSEGVPQEKRVSECLGLCIQIRSESNIVDGSLDAYGLTPPKQSLHPVDGLLYTLHPGVACPMSDLDSYGFPEVTSPVCSRPLEPPLWPISSYNTDLNKGTNTSISPWIPSLPLNRDQSPKHVYFAGSPTHSIHRSEHSVPPYCEVYGQHPSSFNFGPEGERIPTPRSIEYIAVLGGFGRCV